MLATKARFAWADTFLPLTWQRRFQALQAQQRSSAIGLPALGIILDVLDEEALSFYNHYEVFEPFTDNPMRLFASMHMLRQI